MTTNAPRTDAVAPGPADVTAPWIGYGIGTGVLGAFVIAAFFFVVDTLAGRPFATPNTLGAAFFQGGLPEPGPIEPAFVAGYTIMHGTIFVFLGLTAAFATLNRTQPLRRTVLHFFGVWALLFVACEAILAGFGEIFMPGLLGELGVGHVTVANLLAAAAMAGVLERGARLVTPA